MTRLFDLSLGKGQELMLAFQNAGLTAEQAQILIDNPQKARLMIAALEPTFELPACLRVSPEELLERALQINVDRRYDIDRAAFTAPIPELTVAAHELLLPVMITEGGVGRNFELHTTTIRDQFKAAGDDYWQWDGLKSDAKNLRLTPRTLHYDNPGSPTLYWVIYEPFAHWDRENGHTVQGLWDGKVKGLAHVENLNAIELLPDWVRSMDGENVPYINLPGYQVKYGSDWSCCPYVGWWSGDRRLGVDADSAAFRRYGFASPRVREC
jgi:hypothetical protein